MNKVSETSAIYNWDENVRAIAERVGKDIRESERSGRFVAEE